MIGIIGAMDQEIKAYLNLAQNIKEIVWHNIIFYRATLCNKEVCIVKSGVGKVLSATICQKMIDEFLPSTIIFTGVAGALNSTYNIGDIIISTDLMQHDMDATLLGCKHGQVPYSDYHIFRADGNLIDISKTIKVDGHNIHFGRILTGDTFVSSQDSKRKFFIDELKGDAVEMEGAAIAQVCTLNKIPYVVVRTISDKADGEACENFEAFLPQVADNSSKVVSQLLQKF